MYSTTLHTERHILIALAAGDREVTAEIYRKNYPVVKGWMIKNGGNDIDSADVFQEALIILFGKVQEEDFQLTCSVGTYLLAITKRLWYKRLESRNKFQNLLVGDGMQSLDDIDTFAEEDLKIHKEREVHYDLLENALEQIGEPCRSLLKAYYHEDKNMQEIAAGFGYTNAENAKNQKYKCLSRLKKIFFNLKEK